MFSYLLTNNNVTDCCGKTGIGKRQWICSDTIETEELAGWYIIGNNCSLDKNNTREEIVSLYSKYGEQFVERVSNVFTICLNDKRRKKIIVVRGRAGGMPAYYVDKPKLFAVATDEQLLLNLPGVSRELENNWLICLLYTSPSPRD